MAQITADSDTPATDAAQSQLLVGYGKADITPTESVPLAGYGTTEQRMSTGFISYMYAIALAITDANGETGIIIATDAIYIHNDLGNKVRQAVSTACKIPADNVIISALHQHSAPDMNNSLAPSGITYKDRIFIPGTVEAAEAAMADRAAVTAVQMNTVETQNLNFIRHYILDDGTYAGSNFGDMSALGTTATVAHASDIDNTLQLVKFVRKGQTTESGKEAKDIILANFQGHPLRGVTNETWYSIHSDVPGIFRDELEKELDVYSIYFSGASGNVALDSAIPAEKEKQPKDYKAQGKKLAAYAIEAESSYTDISLTSVKASKVTVQAERYTSDDAERAAKGKEAWDYYVETGSEELVKKYGFESKYAALYADTLYKRQPGFSDVDLFVLSFGDLAVVAAPYEMFCASGMNIKEGSPFDMTIIASVGNGGNGYLPTEFAWDYGCYEQYSSNFVRGTAEQMETAFIQMLNDLHSQYE